jgi:3-oxoacyl-[acyl-carrier-protein] synthase-1
MATAFAPNLPDSCAAVRAGISRIAELKVISLSESEALGQEPVTGCAAPYIAPGLMGFAKVLVLGEAALTDLLSRRPLARDVLHRAGVFVNLSNAFYEDAWFDRRVAEDPRPPSAVWAKRCEGVIPVLLQRCGVEIPVQHHHLCFGGHAGFVQCLQHAASLLSAGRLDGCLVGGIDSCIDPGFLRGAAAAGVLKTSANAAGFIPGEAAAFVWIERRPGDGPAALLRHTSLVENGPGRLSDDPPDGAALASAIRQVLSEPLVSILGDLNGDDYRAREWGNALVRLRARHDLADVPLRIPCLAFGDTGAASGPVGLCLGAAAQSRGWLPPGVLVQWLVSDSGSRAALSFSAMTKER